jgi:hypothetical protein
VVILPGPALRQLPDDGRHPFRLPQRIEDHEVAEARHRWPHRPYGGCFVNGETLRQILAHLAFNTPPWRGPALSAGAAAMVRTATNVEAVPRNNGIPRFMTPS